MRRPRGVTSAGWISFTCGAGSSGFVDDFALSLPQPARTAEMNATPHSEWTMRTSIAILALASACGDNANESGYAGDYQMVSLRTQQGSCGGAGEPAAVPDTDAWFRLVDQDGATGPLIAYYPCHELGACSTVLDLYRSFGAAPDGWLTVVASAIQPPCMLGYRRRVLSRIDEMTITIDDTLAQQVDDTLSGDACSLDEARARQDVMPCVAESVWTAELRMP